MGGFEASALAGVEPTLEYHPIIFEILTVYLESGIGTVSGG